MRIFEMSERKKKITHCPDCGVKLGWYLRSSYPDKYVCDNCSWNNKTPGRVTKERYAYWYRLARIRSRAHQIYPPKVKQPLDILMCKINALYAEEVPRGMQQHIESARNWILYQKAVARSFPNGSRWEYHMMREDGIISTWHEYERFYVERRKLKQELENEPIDDYGADDWQLENERAQFVARETIWPEPNK